MIARNSQLYIVIDPMWSGVGWEYDLGEYLQEYLKENRPAIKQTIQTLVGQEAIREKFILGEVGEKAVFLFTEASSDLVILVNRFSKKYKIPVRSIGLWRRAHVMNFEADSYWEKNWWIDFDKACYKALEKSFLFEESYRHQFTKKVALKNYSSSIGRGTIPASVVKESLLKLQPVEFKTDMILIATPTYNPEHRRMFELLFAEMKFDMPVSLVFAYENGTPTRDQMIRWLFNAKVVINFDVQNTIGDDVYEYYAAKCIPLCNAPGFYQNLVPWEWRLETKWFTSIGTFIDAMPIIKHRVKDALINYDTYRSKIDQLDNRFEKTFFSKDNFIKKLY